jgi:hypothetical protein
MNRKRRRAQGAQERQSVREVPRPLAFDAPEGEPCGCGDEFPVDVSGDTKGRYSWRVAGQPGCFWLWWVEDEGVTVAEGECPTRDEAVEAATFNVDAFIFIDARDGHPWDGKPN